jgi:hypothetical protein
MKNDAYPEWVRVQNARAGQMHQSFVIETS